MTSAVQWIDKLKREGFRDVRVCPIPPNEDLPEHTHDMHTVHVILDGELIITDREGTRTFRPGDRVEFPAGTTHKARGSTMNGTMIIGVKQELYRCHECGLHYADSAWAEKCEAWCKEHRTCNIEIAAHAVESKAS